MRFASVFLTETTDGLEERKGLGALHVNGRPMQSSKKRGIRKRRGLEIASFQNRAKKRLLYKIILTKTFQLLGKTFPAYLFLTGVAPPRFPN